MPLKEFQIPIADAHLASLERHRFFINACTTGAGKTFTSLDVIRRRGRKALIIAPKIVLTQWRRAAEDMGVTNFIADITNPEQLSKPSGCRWYSRQTGWMIPPGLDVFADEVHRNASGEDSATALAYARLKAYTGSSLTALSATVACSPLQLRMLGYWGGLHPFSRPEYRSWCRMNGCYDVKFGCRSELRFTKNRAEADRVMSDIRKAFGDMMLSLGPDDIPGFPDETVVTRRVDLSKRDAAEIEEAYATMSERLKAKGVNDMASLIKERQRVERVMAAVLAELAADSAEDGNSAVVFVNFTEPREAVLEHLRRRGVTDVSQVYGTGSDGRVQQNRQEEIDAFQANRNRVILLNASAGGCGVSCHDILHERPRESFIVPSFSPHELLQSMGRIRRVGGTKAVQNIVIAAGTVMERVAASVENKLGNLESLLDSDMVP